MQKSGPIETQAHTDLWALSIGHQKREYWIRTVTKEALKALRCTHV